jgi:putative iron-regulated protein
MKRKFLLLSAVSLVALSSCNKKEDPPKPEYKDGKTLVARDFAKIVGISTYTDLNNAATKLKISAENYETAGTQWNFEELQNIWKRMHSVWEISTALHFGPVDDGGYADKMDKWPANINELNVLLADANKTLEQADIEKLPDDQKSMHCMEYILFGKDGNRTAESVTGREKKYLSSLAKYIQKNCQDIYKSWTGSFHDDIFFAGTTSGKYKSKRALFVAMSDGMHKACLDLVRYNLGRPYDFIDSSRAESPYSNTSLADIKMVMQGVKNTYYSSYGLDSGYGLKYVVNEKNSGLDSKFSERLTLASKALDKLTPTLDKAIYTQHEDVKIAIDAIDSLRSTIDLELKPFLNSIED